MALIFLLAGAVSQVPLTRAIGAAALTATASLLLPVEPHDGAAISARAAVLFDMVLVVLAAALFLGWL